jgi:hypothetical protein
MRWWLGALLVAAVSSPARAGCGGCPNNCQITLGSVSASPPLPTCVTLAPSGETCACGVFVAFASDCGSPTSIIACPGATSAAVTDGAAGCQAVDAQHSLLLQATGNGQQQWVVSVAADGVTSTVMINATVKDFDSDSGCSVIPNASRRGVAAALILAAAAALLGARRRTRRAPR